MQKRKFARDTTLYRHIDGIEMTVHPHYQFCNRGNCSCRISGKKHGPYWKAHYYDNEAKKLVVRYIGRNLPEE